MTRYALATCNQRRHNIPMIIVQFHFVQQKILAARIHVTMRATVSATVKLIMSVNVEKGTLE